MYKIFPELDTDVLCKLSEMEDIRPSKVRELVPEASAAQIAAFLRIAEVVVKEDRDGRQKPAKIPRALAFGDELERISLLGDLKGLQADSKQVPELDCPTSEKSDFFNSLK